MSASRIEGVPDEWNLFLSNLGEDAAEPKGFWRLKDAIDDAQFALGAGMVDTAVITRASDEHEQAVKATPQREGGEGGWRPIKDVPLKTKVIVWFPHWSNEPFVAVKTATGWWADEILVDDEVEPIAWQPLPPPPAETGVNDPAKPCRAAD